MADPLDRFRVGVPASQQEPVAPDADPLGRFRVDNMTPPIPVAPTSLGQEFNLGFERGNRNFAAMMGGLAGMIGRESGIESLERAGLNFAAEMSESANASVREGEVERFSEIESAGGFFKWAAAGLGEAIPSLASAASSGGIGGVAAKKLVENRLKAVLAGRVSRTLMKKGATPDEASAAARRLINSEQGQRWLAESVFRGKSTAELTAAAMRTGGQRGVFVGSAAPQIGAVDLELQEAGIDSGMTSLIAGVAGGALETLPIIKFMDKLFPGVDRQLSKTFVKDFAVATGQQHLLEGGTEALQEIIQIAALAYHDPTFDPWSPEARTRVLDAYAAGALVGTVMGAAGEAGGQLNIAIREGAVKRPALPELPRFEFKPTERDVYPDGFEPADNTLFQEIQNRVYSSVGPRIEAAVNSVKNQLDPIMEALNVELNPGMNREGVRLFTVIKDAHESFINDHKEILTQLKGYAQQQTRRIYESAAAIRDPEQRQKYIDDQVRAFEAKVASIADTLRRRAAARDQDVTAEVDNMDFDDDMLAELGLMMTEDGDVVDAADSFSPGVTQDVFDEEETRVGPSGRRFTRKVGPEPVQAEQQTQSLDRAEPGDLEAPVAFTFGKNQKRPQIGVSGREEVVGYDDDAQAELGIQTLLRDIPNATRDDFTIREQEDGSLVVETQNPEFAEDLAFNESVRKANRVANKGKREGNFSIEEEQWGTQQREEGEKGPLGMKSPSLNLMQLAWDGMKLIPKNEAKPTLMQAFEASIAKMLDRGMINGATAQSMLDQFREDNPNLINDPDPEIYAPVTNYRSRNAAVAGMLKVRDRVAAEMDVEWGWPKSAVDVTENADGTWSWGITKPDLIKRLRRKNPEQVKSILRNIRRERRSEKLSAQKIGPGGRDIGVSADPRGTFAGDPDQPVVQRGQRTLETLPTRDEDGNFVYREVDDSGNPTGRYWTDTDGDAKNLRPLAIAPEDLGSLQRNDQRTQGTGRNAPRTEDAQGNLALEAERQSKLPSEFEARNRANDEATGKVDRRPRDNTKTAPNARQPQTESDNRILKRIARTAKTKVLIGMEFDKDGSLTKAIGDLARFVQKTLGLENEIIVMDDAGLRLAIQQGLVSDPIFQQTLEDPNVHARNIRVGDRSFVYLSNTVLSDPSMTTIALGHELGHHLYQVAWGNLTDKGQQALRDAYLRDTGNDSRNDPQGFNEWMADQLAAWMVNKRLPRNAVEKFFFTVGSKIRQLFNYLNGGGGANVQKRFRLNQTFSDFADAVAERAKRAESPGANPLRDEQMRTWFKNEGVVMYKWFGKPTKDNMQLPFDARQVSQDSLNALKRIEQNYPAIAKRAATLRNWVAKAWESYLGPSTGVMKQLAKEIPIAGEVVKIFGRQDYGKPKLSSNYHQRVNLMKGQFLSKFDKVRNKLREDIKKAEPALKGRRLEAAVDLGMIKLGRSLRKKEGNPNAQFTPLEQEVRSLFDEMHTYARQNGLPVGKIINYLPKQFDKAKLTTSEARNDIINHLVNDKNMSMHEARRFYENLLDPHALDGRATMDAVETPGFKAMNSRELNDKFFDKYLDNNLDALVANYVNAVVKRAEFNRVLGEPMPAQHDMSPKEAIRQGLWDPKARYHKILRQAKKEGATDEQMQIIEKYIDANLGQLGRDDISPGLRKWMAGVMAYQNMRVLAFTVFASLPDMVGPAIRANDMGLAWKSMKKHIHEMATNDNALAEMARAYGIISDTANEHIMTEYVDNHYMSPTLRQWNDNFFKYTGLNWYTDFTRKYALQVGIDYIQQMALDARSKDEKKSLRAKAALKELGINAKQVEDWVKAGKPTYNSLVSDQRKYPTKVAEALVQFVDESIMRPNPSQRPIMASHPGAMLVYHLKGYMYAVSDVVVGRIAHNVSEAQGVQNTLWALSPAIAMMALTAVGLELRELIQYAGSNRTPRTDRMDSWEYVTELVTRSGLTGYAQLAIDFEGASDRGMAEIAGIGGPTLSQIGDWLSRPATQNIPKSIPILGQTQGGRDAIRTLL